MFPSMRPPLKKRTFHSKAVEELIAKTKAKIADPELAWLFENCYPNTLDTTVDFGTRGGKPDAFVITGDIDAMWLRDSSAQVQPYLDLCPRDPQLARMIAGLIHRQTACILLDSYANAFFKDGSRVSEWHKDHTVMKPGVHERKWELDSLCYCIRLAHQYWKITGDTSVFDEAWGRAMQLAVDTMLEQQRKNGPGSYTFMRDTTWEKDTMVNQGYGRKIRPVGMICSAFRNSDDACKYLFNIPENLFAVVALRQLAEIVDTARPGVPLAKTCRALADEVERAVRKHGLVDSPDGRGRMYAYECDGLDHHLLIDDPGLPGLVSIPYLGYGTVSDPVYRNSRRFALSPANPFYHRGKGAEGAASPHIPGPMIWPMGIIGRALTSTDDEEISLCLSMLKRSHAGTGFMHESFHKDDAAKFTRSWFAWVNGLFGELIVKISRERPELLRS
jgi:hypothetical protein